jgi:hypothetical protein
VRCTEIFYTIAQRDVKVGSAAAAANRKEQKGQTGRVDKSRDLPPAVIKRLEILRIQQTHLTHLHPSSSRRVSFHWMHISRERAHHENLARSISAHKENKLE